MAKAIIVKLEDWEGLYVDGRLVGEGHTLNEGEDRITWALGAAEEHGFDLKELEIKESYDEEFLEEMENSGNLPSKLEDVAF